MNLFREIETKKISFQVEEKFSCERCLVVVMMAAAVRACMMARTIHEFGVQFTCLISRLTVSESKI